MSKLFFFVVTIVVLMTSLTPFQLSSDGGRFFGAEGSPEVAALCTLYNDGMKNQGWSNPCSWLSCSGGTLSGITCSSNFITGISLWVCLAFSSLSSQKFFAFFSYSVFCILSQLLKYKRIGFGLTGTIPDVSALTELTMLYLFIFLKKNFPLF